MKEIRICLYTYISLKALRLTFVSLFLSPLFLTSGFYPHLPHAKPCSLSCLIFSNPSLSTGFFSHPWNRIINKNTKNLPIPKKATKIKPFPQGPKIYNILFLLLHLCLSVSANDVTFHPISQTRNLFTSFPLSNWFSRSEIDQNSGWAFLFTPTTTALVLDLLSYLNYHNWSVCSLSPLQVVILSHIFFWVLTMCPALRTQKKNIPGLILK